MLFSSNLFGLSKCCLFAERKYLASQNGQILFGFPPTFSHSFSAPLAEDEEEDEIFDSVRKGEAGGVARRLDEDDEDEDPVLR